MRKMNRTVLADAVMIIACAAVALAVGWPLGADGCPHFDSEKYECRDGEVVELGDRG